MKLLSGILLIAFSLIIFGRALEVQAGYGYHSTHNHSKSNSHIHKHDHINHDRGTTSSGIQEPTSDVQHDDEVPRKTPQRVVATGGGGIVIGCSDPKASNYSKWAVSLPNERCEYEGSLSPDELKKLLELRTELNRVRLELMDILNHLINC